MKSVLAGPSMEFIPAKFVSLQMAGAPAGVDGKILLRIDCILSVEPNGDELVTSVITVSFPVLATKSNYYVVKGSVSTIERQLDIALGRVQITCPENKSNHELAS